MSINFDEEENGYYTVSVFESHDTYNLNLWYFKIHKATLKILYYDVTTDENISLEKWRENTQL